MFKHIKTSEHLFIYFICLFIHLENALTTVAHTNLVVHPFESLFPGKQVRFPITYQKSPQNNTFPKNLISNLNVTFSFHGGGGFWL